MNTPGVVRATGKHIFVGPVISKAQNEAGIGIVRKHWQVAFLDRPIPVGKLL